MGDLIHSGVWQKESLRDSINQQRVRLTEPFRIGYGYDVHRLVPDRPLILGGVEIPFEKGLEGHSDADVIIHSVIDAILGAIANGDIGRHFPDSEDRYKGIDSRVLLRKIRHTMLMEGYKLGNLDVTVSAQRPKLSPYIDRMRRNIALDLNALPECVSIKATTEEGLGISGSGAGIVSAAVVMLTRLEE